MVGRGMKKRGEFGRGCMLEARDLGGELGTFRVGVYGKMMSGKRLAFWWENGVFFRVKG